MTLTATYTPEDNKLRLYASTRLDKELYQRVKDAGFRWAPRQELFVAPMWTPGREDLLIELCGEVGDEDTSLVDRAEERAERFSEYQENRAADAESAHATVEQVSERFAGGQPILVGHHSEKRARKDAERIENGMRRALKMWETAEYWKHRAAGAIRHAKCKELPAVRARRIKTLEADQRKHQRDKDHLTANLTFWQRGDLTAEIARAFCNFQDHGGCKLADGERHWSAWGCLTDRKITVAELQAQRLDGLPRLIAHVDRWLSHLENRLTYERAMLADSGGTVADKTGPEKGGGCKCWASPRGGWAYIQKVNKVSVTILDNWGNGGENFTRTIPFDNLKAVMTLAEVQEKRAAGLLVDSQDKTGYFLRDTPADMRDETPDARNERLHQEHPATLPKPPEPAAKFDALRETLKAGIEVVTAPQLFVTPAALAERMVDLAEIQAGQDVLEPSAGTGAIVNAIRSAMVKGTAGRCAIIAVEINPKLAHRLAFHDCLGGERVHRKDFLECNGDLGQFERVLMNPPFENGGDIAHIRHALTMLKPGGRLVAICADGPRQNAVLKPLAEERGQWEPLPADTFKESGTSVRTVLLTINREPELQDVAATPQTLFPL